MSKAIVRRRHHSPRRHRAHRNPKMSKGMKWALIGLGIAVVGGGGYYWYTNHYANVSLTLAPGAMTGVSLSLGRKQTLTLKLPSTGALQSVTDLTGLSTNANGVVTPTGAGSTTLTATWTDQNGTQQVSTIPVTITA